MRARLVGQLKGVLTGDHLLEGLEWHAFAIFYTVVAQQLDHPPLALRAERRLTLVPHLYHATIRWQPSNIQITIT